MIASTYVHVSHFDLVASTVIFVDYTQKEEEEQEQSKGCF